MARKGQLAGKRSWQLAQEYSFQNTTETNETYDSEDDYNDFNDDAEGGSKVKRKTTGAQILPVAEIDDDWEGEPLDGATYLALAQRANLKLPSSTRVVDPYRAVSPVLAPNVSTAQAGPSRHGALPTESWITSFRTHFQDYRKSVTSKWPPKPRRKLPADIPPFPDFEHRHEWIYWMCGYGRGQLSRVQREQRDRQRVKDKAFSPSRPANEDEEVEAALVLSPMNVLATETVVPEDEEEAWMNENGVEGPEAIDEESDGSGELENEEARHRPREPTLTILSHLDTRQIITILIQVSIRLSKEIDYLSTQLSLSLLDSPPVRPASLHPLPNIPPTRHPNPLPSHLTTWAFALLCVLDGYLLPDDIHHLRELARVIMRVGGWRYILAVQAGEVGEGWSIGSRSPQGYEANAQGELGPIDERTDESGVDETLNRCWLLVNAIAAGWAQHDLLDSLETLFK